MPFQVSFGYIVGLNSLRTPIQPDLLVWASYLIDIVTLLELVEFLNC